MHLARVFRNFFIGKNTYINSRAEFKRVLLTGYLSLLCVVSNWAYMLFDTGPRWPNFFLNSVFCLVGLSTLLCLRLGKYTVAKLLIFIAAYSIVFFFCCIEPFETGVSFYLVLFSVGALALFGHEQRHIAIMFTALGVVFFILAYLTPFKLIPTTEFSEDYIFNNFVLNFIVSLVTSILVLMFMIDVSRYSEKSLERKEAEAQEKNKELTKLNTELDRFVYSVSHDLRSPLATITGIVNIGKYAENLEEAKKYFAMIENRLKAQDFFIREIIDFYRNSRTDIKGEPIKLQEEVQSIVNEHSYSESPVSINYQVTIDSEVEIISDKVRLRSILTNLIGNAVKYHDTGKNERFIKVGAERNNGHISITVEDNGLGIGGEHLKKIFEMFYRASTDSKGSGLGLFIAQETATKLGGKIHVESELGKGSKFSLDIPLNSNLN